MIEIARVGKIEIAYERLGDPSKPPVLLIMGLGAQLIAWPDGFCQELIDRGLCVIRFDNRDVGQSTHMTDAPIPDFTAVGAGDLSSVAYTLSDMAADAVGLLDVLKIPSAHIVGASLGGFVAQTIAIEHRDRVRTLTSMMSSTGDRSVGQIKPEGQKIFTLGMATDREGHAQRSVAGAKIIGSPGYPPDEAMIAERARRSFDRGFDPVGPMRQGLATVASGDRTAKLKQLHVPALVIHGDSDLLVDVSGGRATAAAIEGAKLVIVPGMGHDMPKQLWAQFATEIYELTKRG